MIFARGLRTVTGWPCSGLSVRPWFVQVLRRRSWRVLGTWVDLLGAIGALWACLIANELRELAAQAESVVPGTRLSRH
jgi:hypothetical protein